MGMYFGGRDSELLKLVTMASEALDTKVVHDVTTGDFMYYERTTTKVNHKHDGNIKDCDNVWSIIKTSVKP